MYNELGPAPFENARMGLPGERGIRMWQMKKWLIWSALPFIVLGLIFLFIGVRTDPGARTGDGYSLKWFWYIMGFWFIGLTVAVYAGIFYFVGRSRRRADRLSGEGLRGTARVESSHATGSEMNNIPQVEMELRIELEGIPPYTVTHKEHVNPVNLAAVRPGASVQVLVDPVDPRRLSIDWSGPEIDSEH